MPHIHEKIDFTVEVFIVYDDKILLRKHDKYKMWLAVGGHVELDEDPNQSAIREVKEEVGLDISLVSEHKVHHADTYMELIPPAFMNRHRINDGHEHVTMVYFAKSNSDYLILSDSEKSEECRWFSRDELDELDLMPHIRKYALAALDIVR
jgi:8-oxo-dGTP pyrophosphatase MutT (NUDIX family)